MTDSKYNAIPDELKRLHQWVVRKGKVPHMPTGGKAKANEPDTWATFQEVVEAVQTGNYDGIGFEFYNNGYVGVDLDTVRNPDTGYIAPEALEIIHSLNSYTEISPSGYGFHIIARADIDPECFSKNRKKLPANGILREATDKDGNKKIGRDSKPEYKQPEIEMYVTGRYFTMTGNVYEGYSEINECTEAVNAVYNKYLAPVEMRTPDPPVATPVYNSDVSGGKDYIEIGLEHDLTFRSLWDGGRPHANESADDQALFNKLAYWCNRDTELMIEKFFVSPHYQTKDDYHKRKCGRDDYIPRTASEAVSACQKTAEEIDREYQEDKRRKVTHVHSKECEEKLELLKSLRPDTNPKYNAGGIGSAALFADVFRDEARCIYETKQWYVFDGKRWAKDPQKLRVMELCKRLADALWLYCGTLPEDENSKAFSKSVLKWRELNKRKAIVEDAASVYPIQMSEFDNAPYLFNCQNGTLNLENGEFHPHRASDMLTMLAGVSYDPEAQCSRWKEFITEIMQGDKEKELFLQKALGYALTGDTSLECFFVLYGATTRNGKGTTMETFKHLMGDYGAAASPQTIARKDSADSRAPSEDIARLKGKRFVNLSEPDQGMILSAATVKTLTGNDTVSARFLHENSFEFIPEFKLYINTNYLPRVTDPTVFSSGRVNVITFERHFKREEQDKNLKKTLMQSEAQSGILNWCIEGLQRMQLEGLNPPASVMAATAEYKKANDKIAMFFADRLEANPQNEVVMETLFAAFQSWCSKNGYKATARNKFNAEVRGHCGDDAIKRVRPSGYSRENNPVTCLLGYTLLPEVSNS